MPFKRIARETTILALYNRKGNGAYPLIAMYKHLQNVFEGTLDVRHDQS